MNTQNNIGNRISSSDDGKVTNYTTNNLNQHQTEGVFTPMFDADGNQLQVKRSIGVWDVEYNDENRPIKFTQGNKTIEMSYDYMGRRINTFRVLKTKQYYGGFMTTEDAFNKIVEFRNAVMFYRKSQKTEGDN